MKEIEHLPRTSTGYSDKGLTERDAKNDLPAIEWFCKQHGYTLLTFLENKGSVRTYRLAVLGMGDLRYFFFLNKYAPLLAVAKCQSTFQLNELEESLPANLFIDLAEAWDMEEWGFAVLPRDLLISPINPEQERMAKLVSQLDNAEFAAFSYWEPKAIGEALFNAWLK